MELSCLYPGQPSQLPIEVNGKTFPLGYLHKLCSLPRAASLDEANGTRPKKCTVGVIFAINNQQIELAVGPVVTYARYIKPRPKLCRNILIELIETEAVRTRCRGRGSRNSHSKANK